MSSRVCCIKEKPYWYDRVHSDCPALQDVHLDVAAVREELKSYQKWTSHLTNHTACSSVVDAALTHCQQAHYSSSSDRGFPCALDDVCCICTKRRINTQSSIWNSSIFLWSLQCAIRIMLNHNQVICFKKQLIK